MGSLRTIGLALVGLFLALAAVPAAAPPVPTPLQREKLRECARLEAALPKLAGAGKLDELLAAAERIAALEKAALGPAHPRTIESLRRLAWMQERVGRFAPAERVRAEVFALEAARLGKGHWRVTDARLELEHSRRLAKMTAAQRRALADADRLSLAGARLYQRGKLQEATVAIGKAYEVRKELLGEDHPLCGDSLNSLGVLHKAAMLPREALAASLKALAVRKKALGEGHPEYATSLNNLAVLYEATGRQKEALALYQRALAIRRKALGEAHPEHLQALSNLAGLYEALGRHREALPLCLALRDLTRKARGEASEDYALNLTRLARLYQALARYDEALPLYAQARDVYRKALGEEHPSYAASLNNLASLYQAMGRHALALPLMRQARDRARKAPGETSTEYATCLNNLANLYQAMGRPGEALPLHRQARDVYKKALGEGHPSYADSLHNLALLYQTMGRYDDARALHLQALRIWKKALGVAHPRYARGLNSLAVLYQEMGRHGEALPLLLQARDVFKKAPGEDHPQYATSLNNLAALYRATGRPGDALPLRLSARDLYKKTLGVEHPSYAISVSNLAVLYQDLDQPEKALPLMIEARDRAKKALGEHHPTYAICSNNLALLYKDLGRREDALPLYVKALDLMKKAGGEDHPGYAASLSNLAGLYQEMGRPRDALPLYLRGRDVRKKALGEAHPLYALSLTNLAMLYHALGRHGDALASSGEALVVLDRFLDGSFSDLGEHQRLALAQQARTNLDGLLSVAEEARAPAGARHDAVLAWKGRTAARQREERLLRARPELRPALTELQEARSRLTFLALQQPSPAQHAGWLKQLAELRERRERLEGGLARKSAELRKAQKGEAPTSARLAAALPADTAFVDFLFYDHFSPPPTGKGRFRSERRLLAFVARKGRPTTCLALGRAEVVERAVAGWLAEAIRPPASADAGTLRRTAAELRRRVWSPLEAQLAGCKTVLVSPDGALCQFPFAALPGRKAEFLLEELAVGYAPSGRHLLELLGPADKRKRGDGLLIVGGVEYGPGIAYDPLPFAAVEARRCREQFQGAFPSQRADLLSGKTATAEALAEACGKGYRHLHLATHGFFEPAERVERLASALRGRREGAAWAEQVRTLRGLPLLRCGLALAGANRPPNPSSPERSPGVLTGEGVEGLDLRGCELAVLSACQTGRGDLAAGEGVLGLQRAFHAAGARGLACSLWSVNDAATAVLMEEFYANLWGKKLSRLEALRRAQLTVMKDPARVRRRALAMEAEGRKRGVAEALLRGPKGRVATDLPDGGKVEAPAGRSPVAWWAAFVLSGDGK